MQNTTIIESPESRISGLSQNAIAQTLPRSEIDWNDWNNLDLAEVINTITGTKLWEDLEDSENIANATTSIIRDTKREYFINNRQCFDGNLKVLHWYHHLRHIPHHIFFTFHYKTTSLCRGGIDAGLKRQKLIQEFIYTVRKDKLLSDIDLKQRDLNIFGTGEEFSPNKIHTHCLLSLRNPTKERIERIFDAMKRLIPNEVEDPADIQLVDNSLKAASYTCKTSKTISEKEILWTTGYWKFVIKTKKALGIF